MNTSTEELDLSLSSHINLENKSLAKWQSLYKIFSILYYIYVGITIAIILITGIMAVILLSNENVRADFTQAMAISLMQDAKILFYIGILAWILGAVLNIWQIILGYFSYSLYGEKSIHKTYLIAFVVALLFSLVFSIYLAMIILPAIYLFELNKNIKKAQV